MMKKVCISTLIATLAVEITGVIVNLISYAVSGNFLLAMTIQAANGLDNQASGCFLTVHILCRLLIILYQGQSGSVLTFPVLY